MLTDVGSKTTETLYKAQGWQCAGTESTQHNIYTSKTRIHFLIKYLTNTLCI